MALLLVPLPCITLPNCQTNPFFKMLPLTPD